MTVNQITEHIWLGSIMALRAEKELKRANVTHILSVLTAEAPGTDPRWSKLPIFSQTTDHLHIRIDDVDDVDILEHFNATNAFIDHAVQKNEGVLVHCAAGISRSSTCVCAYLMKRNKWDSETAINFVKGRRPVVNPNPGFREQLDIYYESGYEVNKDSKLYREWKLKHQQLEDTRSPIYTGIAPAPPTLNWRQVIPKLLEAQKIAVPSPLPQQLYINETLYAVVERVKVPPTDPIHFVIGEADFSIDQTKLRALLNQTLARSTGLLRCKACSTKIATTNSIVTHETSGQGFCQHYFIEPVEWMRPELERGDVEGKLGCPKCLKKVGSYLWQGSKCTCGTWVTPSIKLSKAKVDGMGLPPLL